MPPLFILAMMARSARVKTHPSFSVAGQLAIVAAVLLLGGIRDAGELSLMVDLDLYAGHFPYNAVALRRRLSKCAMSSS